MRYSRSHGLAWAGDVLARSQNVNGDTQMAVFDYSDYVEMVAREADATAYPYYPSDQDVLRAAPRLLSQFTTRSKVIPPSMSKFTLARLDDSELEVLLRSRVELFDGIEAQWIPPAENSTQRTLVDWLGSTCYVCGAPTRIVQDTVADAKIPHIKTRSCVHCGWWESENHAYLLPQSGLSYESFTLLRRACLREFAIVDDRTPLDAIRNHLIRHERDLNRISPRKLEELVGSVFSDFFDSEAIHVGGPGDGGYDLVLLIGDRPALVQVKQRSDPRKAEAVSEIREFIGALVGADARIGFYVSTARKFSRAAAFAAESVPARAVERLELIDGAKLIDILKLVNSSVEPWRRHAHNLADGVPDFKTDTRIKFFARR